MKDHGNGSFHASETRVLTLWQLEVGNDEKLTGYIYLLII